MRFVAFWTINDGAFDGLNSTYLPETCLLELCHYRRSSTLMSLSIIIGHRQLPSSCFAWNYGYPPRLLRCCRASQIVLVDKWKFWKSKLNIPLSTWRLSWGVQLEPWLHLQRGRLGIPWEAHGCSVSNMANNKRFLLILRKGIDWQG